MRARAHAHARTIRHSFGETKSKTLETSRKRLLYLFDAYCNTACIVLRTGLTEKLESTRRAMLLIASSVRVSFVHPWCHENFDRDNQTTKATKK